MRALAPEPYHLRNGLPVARRIVPSHSDRLPETPVNYPEPTHQCLSAFCQSNHSGGMCGQPSPWSSLYLPNLQIPPPPDWPLANTPTPSSAFPAEIHLSSEASLWGVSQGFPTAVKCYFARCCLARRCLYWSYCQRTLHRLQSSHGWHLGPSCAPWILWESLLPGFVLPLHSDLDLGLDWFLSRHLEWNDSGWHPQHLQWLTCLWWIQGLSV